MSKEPLYPHKSKGKQTEVIITPRHEVVTESYERAFQSKKNPGSGFSFACDVTGKLMINNDLARENYRKCLSGEYDVIDMGIRKYTSRYMEPATFRCACGHVIELATFTNTCEKCGRDYNMSGQALAPRSQWGEETGETATDILRGRHHIS